VAPAGVHDDLLGLGDGASTHLARS
jgi:hypothetical protein